MRVSVASEKQDVYDLTVADAHEFTANGVIVHNCVWAFFELRNISQASWLSAYGAQRCPKCEFAFAESTWKCPRCGTEVMDRQIAVPLEPAPDADVEPAPGSWAAVYHLKRCASGHSYSDKGQGCPRCRSGALHYLRQNGKNVGPSATLGM